MYVVYPLTEEDLAIAALPREPITGRDGVVGWELALRAREWLANASPEELWEAIVQGDIDLRVRGRAGSGIGLSGPLDLNTRLKDYDWATDAQGDLVQWFAGSEAAQLGARDAIECSIDEYEVDMGDASEAPTEQES